MFNRLLSFTQMPNGHRRVNVPQTELPNSLPAWPALGFLFPDLVNARTMLPCPQAKNLGVKTYIRPWKILTLSLRYIGESNHFYHLQTQATALSLLGYYNSFLNGLHPLLSSSSSGYSHPDATVIKKNNNNNISQLISLC